MSSLKAHTAVIPATLEAEAGGSRGQGLPELQSQFKVTVKNSVIFHLKTKHLF